MDPFNSLFLLYKTHCFLSVSTRKSLEKHKENEDTEMKVVYCVFYVILSLCLANNFAAS